MGADSMLFVEEDAVVSPKDTGAGGATDEIPERIPADCRDRQGWRERVDIEISLGGEESGGDEQRVAGKKHADQQSGFGEDDCRQPEQTSPLHEVGKIRDAVEEVCQRLHRADLEKDGRETFKFTATATQSNYRGLASRFSGASPTRRSSSHRQS